MKTYEEYWMILKLITIIKFIWLNHQSEPLKVLVNKHLKFNALPNLVFVIIILIRQSYFESGANKTRVVATMQQIVSRKLRKVKIVTFWWKFWESLTSFLTNRIWLLGHCSKVQE